jgi:hypothetical protein
MAGGLDQFYQQMEERHFRFVNNAVFDVLNNASGFHDYRLSAIN